MIVGSAVSGIAQEAEEFKPSGSAFGRIFWNYHLNLTEDVEQRNSFQVQRAYLGYKYKFSKEISAKITLDGSKTSNASSYTMFVKNALVDWKVADNIKLTGGIMGTKQYKVQESFLNYRYIFKTAQDYFGLGPSTDLGINAEFTASDQLLFNVFILNGEGYTKPQDNLGRMKGGFEVVFKPLDGLTLKGYYDIYGGKITDVLGEVTNDTAKIHTLSLFAGYKTGPVRIGAEFNTQLNGTDYNDIAEDLNLTVLALYGAYTINDNFELFAEGIQGFSNKLEGSDDGWNYFSGDDGTQLIGGLQYQPVKGVKTALNGRLYIPSNVDEPAGADAPIEPMVYLNFEFKF